MNLFKLSWKYLKAKPFATLLSVVLVALGVSLTSILFLLNKQFQDRLYKNIEDIDLVVGAKGSPLQMILSSVYQIDAPTGNIPLKETFVVTKNPYIEKAIPLALGDSYDGFRIVGTDEQYAAHFKAELEEGKHFEKDLEVTVGSRAAKQLNLKIGSTFYGSHGLVKEGGHVHETYAYEVVGILKESNLVLDQLILTNISTVWRMHDDHAGHDHDEEEGHDHGHDAHDHNDEAHEGHDHGHDTHDHSNDPNEGHAHEHHHDEGDTAEEGPHQDDVHNHEHSDEEDHSADTAKAAHSHNHGHDDHGHEHPVDTPKVADNHDGHNHDDHGHDNHGHDKPKADLEPISKEGKDITAYLVQYKKDGNGDVSLRATVEASQIIEENSESLACAKPAIQLQRLLEMTGVGMDFLTALAFIIILISAFSMFISLYSSLKERRYEIALMRVMGASRLKVVAMIILEGLMVATAGFIFGTLVSHIGMELMASHLEETYKYTFSGMIFLLEEFYLAIGALCIGFFAALIPAIQAYKVDISDTLSNS